MILNCGVKWMKPVLIADDHEIVRLGLKKLLEAENYPVIDEVSDGKNLMAALKKHAHQSPVLILDLSMPEISGLDALPLIRLEYPEMPVIILSGFSDANMIREAFSRGARGFVCKNAFLKEILNALQAVSQGKTYLSPEIPSYETLQLPVLPDQKPLEVNKLSRQEKHIFELLRQGKSGKEIAHLLTIKPPTVSTYKKRIFKKLRIEHFSEFFSRFSP